MECSSGVTNSSTYVVYFRHFRIITALYDLLKIAQFSTKAEPSCSDVPAENMQAEADSDKWGNLRSTPPRTPLDPPV
eukprot:m.45160 g.45160  ORF g.45160 m.45160 type:complete len:77 (+) comp33568_c1_seq3:775-1005(+)